MELEQQINDLPEKRERTEAGEPVLTTEAPHWKTNFSKMPNDKNYTTAT
jgi:hypothetical protein